MKTPILTKNLKGTGHLEARRRTFSLALISILILFLVVIPTVSAWEWEFDNIKDYDEETKTVIIANSFIKLIELDKVAELTLDTPQNNRVGRGYQRVAEITINNEKEYENALREMDFYNLKKGRQKTNRRFDYKYKTTETYEVQTSIENCKTLLVNKSCGVGYVSEIRTREVWKDIGKDLPKGNVTIGIYTNVQVGDYIEWIPTFFGVEIDEWASWTEGLNDDLLLYYTFEDETESVVGEYNLTDAEGTANYQSANCLIGDCLAITTDNFAKVSSATAQVSLLINNTLNVWARVEDYANYNFVLSNAEVSYQLAGQTTAKWTLTGTENWWEKSGQIVDTWYMFTLVRNDTGLKIYHNGTYSGGYTTPTFAGGDSNLYLGGHNSLNDDYEMDGGYFDEMGIWNRTLTDAEIEGLFNEGAGLTYVATFIPTVTVTSPTNAGAFASTPQDLEYTATQMTPYSEENWLEFDGSNDDLKSHEGLFNTITGQNLTISGWVNFSSNSAPSGARLMGVAGTLGSSSPQHGILAGNGTGGNQQRVCGVFSNKVSEQYYLCSENNLSTGWHHIVTNWNGTYFNLYIDNTLEKSRELIGNSTYTNSLNDFVIGDTGTNSFDYGGMGDEYRVYNRSLLFSEINEIYSSGRVANSSLTNNGLIAWLPLNESSGTDLYDGNDGTLYSDSIVGATWAINDGDKCWYSLDDGSTNSSTVNYPTNFSSLTADEESNTWTVYCQNELGVGNATTTFTVDTTNPLINITSPNGTISYQIAGRNISLNWSMAETNLDSCWYEYDKSNYSIADNFCTATNFTSFNVTNATKSTVKFFSNDTLGNVGSETSTWEYKVFQNSIEYDSSVLETQSQTISTNISGRNDYNLLGSLIYNGTSQTTTKTEITTNNYLFSSTFDTPGISGTSEVKNFHFNFTEINEANGSSTYVQSNNYEQTVTGIQFGQCTQNLNITMLNFSIYDESTLALLNSTSNATTFQATFDFGANSEQKISNYSITNVSVDANTFAFCTNNETNIIYVNMQAYITAVGYSEIDYFLSNATLTNNTNYINLYLLDENDAVEFFITINRNLKPLPYATIQLSKYFVGEGLYKTTEIDETDVSGEMTAYLDLDKTYKATILLNGTVLDTQEFKATCEAAPCTIELNIGEVGESSFTALDSIFAQNVQYSLDFNPNTKVVTFEFVDTTGLANYFRLAVSNSNSSQGGEIISDETTYTTSGTMTFNATGLTGDFRADAFVSRSPEKLIDFLTWMIDEAAQILGAEGLIATFILIMVVIFGLSFKPSILVMGIPITIHLGRIMGLLSVSPIFITITYGLAVLGVWAMSS